MGRTLAPRIEVDVQAAPAAPWHFLYFLPDPHGQGSLRPTLAVLRFTVVIPPLAVTPDLERDAAAKICSCSRRRRSSSLRRSSSVICSRWKRKRTESLTMRYMKCENMSKESFMY